MPRPNWRATRHSLCARDRCLHRGCRGHRPRRRSRSDPNLARPSGRNARGLCARSPRSPGTSPAQYPAGSGVGVSVLLRQAHGFEGLPLVSEERHPNDLAVAEQDVPGKEELDRKSADSAELLLVKPYENSIANSPYPPYVDLHTAPRREPCSPEVTNPFRAKVH